MRVLKFGGSSLADADRFLRAANIIANSAKQGEVSVVLSAPGKTTNKLVEVIDSALRHEPVESHLSNLEQSLRELFNDIHSILPNIEASGFENQIDTSFQQLRQFVDGIHLLGMT